MQVINEVSSSPEARDAFFSKLEPGAPLVMVNLLKFKEKAEYPDGRETTLSGAQAYGIYGEAVGKMIEAFGFQLHMLCLRTNNSMRTFTSG